MAAQTTSAYKNPKGKKVPGRPSRFDPTMPLHMNLRHSAKKSVSGGAPSVNGSVEDTDNRRTSLDAERPATAHSSGTHASKESYSSVFSPPPPVPDINMADAPPQTSPNNQHMNDERQPRSFSPAQKTSPVTRKRKRSSPSPPPRPHYEEAEQDLDDENDPSPEEGGYEDDTVQLIPGDQLSDHEEPADDGDEGQNEDSPNSSQSQRPGPSYDVMGETSVDATPALTQQHSPATSSSAGEEDETREVSIAKPLSEALQEVADATQAQAVETEPPEDERMIEVAPAVAQLEDIEEQVRTDEDGRVFVKRGGRFGGRRRAQHPKVSIEVAMRRQAHLKTAFRTIARAQKGLLAEITQRTIDDMESKPTLHTEVEEYEGIMRGLDAALAKRKASIQAQHNMKLSQLKATWDGEQEVTAQKCRQQLDDMEENKIDQLQYEALRIARAAQLGEGQDGNETEDEDDVIPRPKRTAYHWKRGAGLDSAHDSRSRLALETQRATKDMQARYNMFQVLQKLPESDRPKPFAFTVMDERPRTAAVTNLEGQSGLDMLVDAGAEAERMANVRVIPNAQAVGLQMLGDLASRPSITGGYAGRLGTSGSTSGQLTGRVAPPSLNTQAANMPTPIQVQMSPRTKHAMGDRFESPRMPPPSTPRHEPTAPPIHSAESHRHEGRPAASPNRGQMHPDRQKILARGGESPRSPKRNSFTTDSIPGISHRRIVSQDKTQQNHVMSPPARRQPEPFSDYPGQRIVEVPEAARKRAASHNDVPPPFVFRSAQPFDVQLEQQKQQGPEPQRSAEPRPQRYDPVRSEAAMQWSEQHSQAGASNGQKNDTATPRSEQIATVGAPSGESTSKIGGESGSGNKKSRHPKTNKAQRDGAPRRRAKKNKLQQQNETPNPESRGTPSLPPNSFAGSPPFEPRGPSQWQDGPHRMHSPYGFNPGPFHHQNYGPQRTHHGFPPHQQLLHHAAEYRDPHHRNNSLPMPPFLWSPQYSSPGMLHPIPQHQPPHHPLPPGVPPEHYSHPLTAPPPPPPGFGQHRPQSPHLQPAGSAPAPFRGQPLAPAGPYSQRQTPAFAQQQQQNGGNLGSGNGRRRTQSDAIGFTKFVDYKGPKNAK